MAHRTMDEFRRHREHANEVVIGAAHLGITRFFRLDSAAYEPGALDAKTKELLGLVASAVLRCNDCIDYHLDQCVKRGWSKDQIVDALNVALIVGGSIFIPHLRHAMLTLEELLREAKAPN